MNDDLWNELTAVFRECLNDDSITLAESTTAKDVPGWDSITHVLLIVAIEKKFRVRFTGRRNSKTAESRRTDGSHPDQKRPMTLDFPE